MSKCHIIFNPDFSVCLECGEDPDTTDQYKICQAKYAGSTMRIEEQEDPMEEFDDEPTEIPEAFDPRIINFDN